MSSETKEVKELNGKKSSTTNSPLNSSTKQAVETSPETSDDDSRKLLKELLFSVPAVLITYFHYLPKHPIIQFQKRI